MDNNLNNIKKLSILNLFFGFGLSLIIAVLSVLFLLYNLGDIDSLSISVSKFFSDDYYSLSFVFLISFCILPFLILNSICYFIAKDWSWKRGILLGFIFLVFPLVTILFGLFAFGMSGQ